MIEKANVVVLLFDRFDHRLDELIEFFEQRCNVIRDIKIHG